MDTIFQTFHQAQFSGSGPHLATTLTPIAPPHDSTLLRRFHKDSNVFSIQKDIESYIRIQQSHLSKTESTAWIDIYVAYWKAIGEILRAETGHHRDDWAIKVYEAWKEVTNLLIRGYSHAGFGAWTMPCLYTVSKYLRVFAIKADEEQAVKVGSGEVKMESDALGDDVMAGFEKNERLEDAARLNSISLSKNCLRALEAARSDMPSMEQFPKSHIVTFRYYVGVIHFLDEEYHKPQKKKRKQSRRNKNTQTKLTSPPQTQAEENLTSAYHMCHRSAHRNKDLLLTYLIPTHLHTTLTTPTPTLLPPHSPLSPLFSPLLRALRTGSLSAFSAALAASENTFVNRRVYLSLERARDLCLRNLLRRIWVLQGGREGSGRVKVAVLARGVRWSMTGAKSRAEEEGEGQGGGFGLGDEEVECLVAGLVFKQGLIKGYISREHATVVLNRKGEAFPGTGV
ncbi:MAG: hypothetical protein LQ344_006194 [Seirophora lacunosa]|nr:MAG: hypothetical protein LQ344_006194 [Seirophora lacunosa]